MTRRRFGWLVATVAIAGSACQDGADPAGVDPATSAPTSLRATVSIEPPTLKIGEVATLEVLVVTPPEHTLLPLTPPETTGLWLLESRTLDVEKSASRWLHRTRLRVRPQDVGPQAWPDHTLVVENAEGERIDVVAQGRQFDVRETMPDWPEQVSPFGLQTPPEAVVIDTTNGWAWAAGGAVSAWLVTALATLAWSRRRASSAVDSDAPPVATEPTELFRWARAEVHAAREQLSKGGPAAEREAANRAARTLRLFVARRFDTSTHARTTPELAADRPPLRVQSRWPYFVRILQTLDDWRFRPTRGTTTEPTLAATLDEAERFIDDAARRGAHPDTSRRGSGG